MDILVDQESGDVIFSNGETLTSQDLSHSVTQRLYVHFRTFKGEWFMDNTYGVPWFQLLGKKGITKSYVDRVLQEEAFKVRGVKEIVSWESSLDVRKRHYEVVFTVKTSTGSFSEPISISPDIPSQE